VIVRGKSDEERQDTGSLRNEEGDDGESRAAAQGPWKPVPTVAVAAPPVKPTEVPEPGLYGMLITYVEVTCLGVENIFVPYSLLTVVVLRYLVSVFSSLTQSCCQEHCHPSVL